MKLLYDGLIADSTLSSLYPSPSYPVANLRHTFLKKRYQSARDVDEIVIMFEDPATVSSIFWGLTNALEVTVELYNAGDALLHSKIWEYPESDIVYSEHFTAIPNVAYAVISLVGESIGVWIGGADFGVPSTYPDPLASWPEEFEDNSVTVESPNGQTSFDRASPLRKYKWDFAGLSREQVSILQMAFSGYGKGRPLFIDAFEENHTFMLPMWGKLVDAPPANKNERYYDYSITVKECR
jgi:hypothetical protein